jgi:hypothetical protein
MERLHRKNAGVVVGGVVVGGGKDFAPIGLDEQTPVSGLRFPKLKLGADGLPDWGNVDDHMLDSTDSDYSGDESVFRAKESDAALKRARERRDERRRKKKLSPELQKAEEMSLHIDPLHIVEEMEVL